MNTFIYPNGMPITITEESRRLNNHTWENNQARVYESDSIQFVFTRLSEIASFHGNAYFLDIGAQSGLYTLYAKYYENIHVDAFEPFPSSYQCLCDNIALNQIQDRVTTYPIALSNIKGKTMMQCPTSHTGLNTLGTNPKRFSSWKSIEIDTDKIDNLFSNRRVDFIKCDTEGWEYFVLSGGLNVLKRDHPDLLIEIVNENMLQCNLQPDHLTTLMDSIGYQVVRCIDSENYVLSFNHRRPTTSVT